MQENNILCEICHKVHDGKYGSGRFCSPQCAQKSRRKNRAKTIARKKQQGTYKKFNPKVSKLQKGVCRTLSKAGIPYEVQHQVGRYYFDIKIGNVLIQVNGDFFHGNPQKYKPMDIIPLPGQKERAINLWKMDLKKKLQAAKRGYRVVYLWQSDINRMSQVQLIQRVMNVIKCKGKEIINKSLNEEL